MENKNANAGNIVRDISLCALHGLRLGWEVLPLFGFYTVRSIWAIYFFMHSAAGSLWISKDIDLALLKQIYNIANPQNNEYQSNGAPSPAWSAHMV